MTDRHGPTWANGNRPPEKRGDTMDTDQSDPARETTEDAKESQGKPLTWTELVFYCCQCDSTCRAAAEMIWDAKHNWGDAHTDEEAVNTFDTCLSCAGYGDEYDLTGERV